jgi:hypothetical protein
MSVLSGGFMWQAVAIVTAVGFILGVELRADAVDWLP